MVADCEHCGDTPTRVNTDTDTDTDTTDTTREQAKAEVWKRNETFLQMLYHHEQKQTVPVVDQHFVEEFRSLDEGDQCKAMEHIHRIVTNREITGIVTHIEELLHTKRLRSLYDTWLKNQTEEWVEEHYGDILDEEQWQRHLARQRADVRLRDEKEKGVLGRTPPPPSSSSPAIIPNGNFA